uniref:EOG090X0COM n=1 Tax=Lynceus sp. MCZ IZ 141354 TaxID=1930659 RepID=A0A9N6ZHC9_9CRUS|nr:EOG090X0COM [Lynceus sp. MCZ IZ 141354]
MKRLTVSSATKLILPTTAVQTMGFKEYVEVPKPGQGIQYKWRFNLPENYTLKHLPIQKLGGRDPVTGRVVVGTRGGGHKKKLRWIDFKRNAPKDGPPLVEKVFDILYDPCRTAKIALIASGDSARFIIATGTMKPGDLITTYSEIPRIPVRPKVDDAHPIGALPIGTEVCCVEKFPGKGAYFAISAGTSMVILKKSENFITLQLPSKHEIAVHEECMATVGRVSNELHNTIHIGSPNRLRWLGFRPRSGLWQRKDGRFGRKIRRPPPVKVYDKPTVDNTFVMTFNVKDRVKGTQGPVP